MCTSKPQLLTPIIKRTSLSLPECPAPPKAQKHNLTCGAEDFPSLPFVVNNGETGVDMMLKPRQAYQASTSFSIKTVKKEQGTRPKMENIAVLFIKARQSKEDLVIGCMQIPHMQVPKAA